ncbi:hypothetical protein BU25DRAFT_476412 [Macroventuria anomochaeta]|uniref:Uncharacterized protein n=1 Tax=Macroventuria anomochaeta TaxID=301207 RepID=A0ACB6RQF4_9PLEO|nr:uncharacterized protein BU25DRAFT_476412 [Macroventuria anomochaeta]KAF2624276.1 hypothetical protein BU25DRAFT_476412 [Macroventuria anomochaeta]
MRSGKSRAGERRYAGDIRALDGRDGYVLEVRRHSMCGVAELSFTVSAGATRVRHVSASPLWNFLLSELRKTAPSRFSAECSRAFLPYHRFHLPSQMAAPGARMRLTVVVEALAEEDAHGQYRELALEAFKERKFAMPVRLEDTFETVWADIEQRYKTNYLNPQQAATFSIKKLQDAYDCDLDMTDTVGAIFEGEPDRKMHMIKVVPHFIYRQTSVVPGSMLRPSGTQKRVGDDIVEGANKRRRIESQQRQGTHEARDRSPNRPIPSTESQQAAVEVAEDVEAGERSARSKSGMSLVELSRTKTGHAPFSSTGVKQESPELEQSPLLNGIDAASPHESTRRPVETATEEQSQDQQASQSRASTPRELSQEAPQQPMDDEVPEVDDETVGDMQTAAPEHAKSPLLDSQEAAIHKSPISSVEAEPAPAPTTRSRRDVYQVPSSPDFMHKKATPDKPARTYGRSPRSGADLLNMARMLGRSTKEKDTKPNGTHVAIAKKARAFQRTKPDEIESTPQEDAGSGPQEESHATSDDDDADGDLTASFLNEATEDRPNAVRTPAQKTAAKPKKPGSLKKPSRVSLVATPASTKRGANATAAATPASTASANKSSAKGKTTTLSTSSKGERVLGEETMARMERLEKLLSASQSTPKRQGNASSPARSGSVGSQDQSNRTSPEVRVPVTKKTAAADNHTETINARLAIQPPTAQRTPLKSPVPLPSSIKKSTPISSMTSKGAVETPKFGKADVFKKPAVKVRESPAPLSSVKIASNVTARGTPRRSEVPLPPNVRHLRRSSSLQSSPLANGDTETNKSSPSAPMKKPANLKNATPSLAANRNKSPVDDPTEPAPTANPINGAIVISSANESSTNYSYSGDEEPRDSSERRMDGTVEGVSTSAELSRSVQIDDVTTPHENIGDDDDEADEEVKQPEKLIENVSLENTQAAPPQTQDKPPSGQISTQAAPWGAESWGFSSLGQKDDTSDNLEQAQEPEPQVATAAAPTSEDKGFAEQEIYSTAIEDNASRSRSASVAVSTRSSPAVSRRPARFLSHSPTPDASESENESDEASAAPSPAASRQANDRDESESESSSDSSQDEDIEMSDLPTESMTDSNANAGPPSSPPLNGLANSTAIAPETSQSTPSQINGPTQRTPVPPPTQQSSQAPRSSQSVSVQTADRRRYTGFRSLREQLADTKAAQATTQKKTFDPRTISLGKLAKGKPPVGFGGDDDESSDDESSSSSSSDSN